MPVENSWSSDYDCNTFGYCFHGVYLVGVCSPGQRFDDTKNKCIEIDAFDCAHHCAAYDCNFNATIHKMAGGGELIPRG